MPRSERAAGRRLRGEPLGVGVATLGAECVAELEAMLDGGEEVGPEEVLEDAGGDAVFALGFDGPAQSRKRRARRDVMTEGGLTRFRRAAEMPLNLEARP